jgi:transcriptional regulator with XRE-family HTH domain
MARKAKAGISEVIKRILASSRKRQGLTQKEAGKLLGKTQEMISAKERRPLRITLGELILMRQLYGFKFAELDAICDEWEAKAR